MWSIDNAYIGMIAHQRRVATVTQQLNAYYHALGRWQTYAFQEIIAADSARVRHELAYYRQQIARWEEELRRLATESIIAGSR